MGRHLSEHEASFIRLPQRAKVNRLLGLMSSRPEQRWEKAEILEALGLSENSRALDEAISEVILRQVELGTDQRLALR